MVEHRLARLVQLGIRQSRYFGRVKTRFQLYLAATVANLTLVAGKLGRSGRTGGGATGRSVVLNPLCCRPCCGQFLRGPARTTVVRDPAHVGFIAQIPLPNQDFSARFLGDGVGAVFQATSNGDVEFVGHVGISLVS